jgi:XRE family aerobic/anaerobic benzoate catabolism transcriptional regulator
MASSPPSSRNRSRATLSSRAATASAQLDALGVELRARRERLGWTQRRLSEASGLSPRFLAQLEAGQGNVSYERLAALCRALGVSPSRLLAAVEARLGGAPADQGALREPADSEPGELELRRHVARLVAERSPRELVEVQRWLEARFAQRRAPVIALVGLRGAGKSTIGPLLAAGLGLRFVEVDQEVERLAGLGLAEIFALHGEAYYRRLERETLAHLLSGPGGLVLATGGGLVTDRESFRLLRRRAVTVWLRARPEDHLSRVIDQGDRRPMSGNPQAMQELRALLAAREPLYAQAELVVETWRHGVEGAVAHLVEQLQSAESAAGGREP